MNPPTSINKINQTAIQNILQLLVFKIASQNVTHV